MRSTLHQLLVDRFKASLGGAPMRVPEGSAVLWTAFLDLHKTRSLHTAGPNPISYAEIEAYCRLKGLPLAGHHVDVVRALDGVWLEHGTSGPHHARQEVTPGAFDAVFG